MNKFLFLIIVVVTASTLVVSFSSTNNIEANAQQQPPSLEKAPITAATSTADPISLGKITIQISQTEQIIIDLPLKSDNKYEVVPIK